MTKFISSLFLVLAMSTFLFSAPYKEPTPVTMGSGTTELVAAQAGKRILLTAFAFKVQNACGIKFMSGSNDITGVFYFDANQGWDRNVSDQNYDELNIITNSGEALQVNCTADPGVAITFNYILIAD